MRMLRVLAPAVFLLLAANSLFAVPLRWTLTGVTFNDGGVGTGSFVYDADTNTYSNINVVTTAGTAFGGGTYHFPDVAQASASQAVFLTAGSGNLTGTPLLAFFLSAPLTSAGGTVTANTLFSEGNCIDATCTNATPLRSITAGSLVSSPIAPTSVPALSNVGMALLVVLLVIAAAFTMRRPQVHAGA